MYLFVHFTGTITMFFKRTSCAGQSEVFLCFHNNIMFLKCNDLRHIIEDLTKALVQVFALLHPLVNASLLG